MMVEDGALFESYKVNFDLVHNSNFTLSDIEEMIPFERDTYIHLHNEHMNSKNKGSK